MEQQKLELLNDVSSENQVSQYVTFDGVSDGAPRVMFVGNSTTRHAPKPDIGWYGNWGMAASAKENDYVHLVMSEIKKSHPKAVFCIVQASIWEINYKNCDYDMYFKEASSFRPDVIVCNIAGNIPNDEFDKNAFKENINKLFKYLSGENENVKIFESSHFFGNPDKCKAIKEHAVEYGATYVEISDIAKDESNLALGKFEHMGVQAHPGDKGMKELALRFIQALKDCL